MPKVNFKGRIRFHVMDSPESTKPTTTIAATIAATTSSLDPVAVQDSPISSYISNLSPLKPVKAAPVAQVFPGLNSPPLVFTSPRIHPHRQSSFLKRPQCARPSSSELSQQDDRAINVAKGVDESGKSDTKLSCGLIFGTEEGDNSSSVDDQCGSPPGCVDEFLADHVEVDCVDLNHSENLTSKQSDNVPKSSSSVADSRDSITEVEKKYDVTKDDRMTLGASPAIFDQAIEKCQEKSPFDTAPDKAEKENEVGDMPFILCPKVEHHDHALDKHYYEHSVTEDTGAGHKVESDCSSQLLLESMQIVEEYKDCVQATRALSSEPVENMMLHDPKASPHHRGMRRRCLQFEGAQQNTTVNSPGSWIPSNSTTSSRSSVIPANSEFLESYYVDVPATPANMQLDNMTQPTFLAFSPRNDGTCSSKVSKPSGIGLHLNSIVNAMPAGFGAIASIKSAERGYLSVRGKKSVSMINRHLSENLENCLISSNVVESTTGSKEDGRHESHPSVAASTARSLSHYSVQPLTNAVLLKPIEQQATACGDKRKSNSGHADSLEECNQSSPKKKRKKSSVTNDGDDCKRCNCKKTKCLKLYCDCFAAGIYCAETCACQECFNRPEYEDTVLETREQIETRNPLAFAPKVIQRNTERQANSTVEGGIISTPSSARHKRGCNCKKSMCLKKYCECYQGNVGCSDGCRCEGCKNVYGRKEEYGMSKDVVNKQAIDERLDASYDERLDMVPSEKGLLHIELCNPRDLTPLTPSFQSSKYHPSPESDPTFLESCGKSFGSPLNSDNHGMTLETGHRMVLSNHSSMDIPSLMSPMTRDWSNGSGAQLVPGSGHFSSVSSLQWRNSPVTPMTRFGGTKFVQVLDSDDNLHDIMEDDTPEILKEVSTSPNAVKVSSPNKKRVSPPKGGLHELGSSSSAGLRTSRKFILQAVPSFPPLTPCLDSKSSDIQSTSDLQGCSSTK